METEEIRAQARNTALNLAAQHEAPRTPDDPQPDADKILERAKKYEAFLTGSTEG